MADLLRSTTPSWLFKDQPDPTNCSFLMMMMMLSVQLSPILGDPMGQASPCLVILNDFFELFHALAGVTFDGVHPPCSLMTWFPSTANSSQHNCFRQ